VKFAFVDVEKALYPVTKLCRCLDISTSGYYAWRLRDESARAKTDRRLVVLMKASFEESRKTYGSPRIHEDLITAGEKVGRKRVIRLMQAEGIVARVRRRYRCTTMSDHDQPIAPNLLDREFEAAAPNQRWVGDTTELLVDGGRLFLAAIVDLFSRFVVGWAVSTINDRHLTIRALEMAIRRRCPDVGLLHHSDQGSTYASDDYQRLLDRHGITCSMSRRGNCYDNAVAESWFSTFKAELGERFTTPGHAKAAAFDYIEAFYNQRRRHSSIGYVSPAEFERRYHVEPIAAAA
jgi:transposase InsO family protein